MLVTAAGGATGHMGAQLAMLAGCRVVATCGSQRKAERLRGLGIHRVINYREEVSSNHLRYQLTARGCLLAAVLSASMHILVHSRVPSHQYWAPQKRDAASLTESVFGVGCQGSAQQGVSSAD